MTVRRTTDAETRIDRADHGAIRLWLRMMATNRLVETRTRRLLQERYATTLPAAERTDSFETKMKCS